MDKNKKPPTGVKSLKLWREERMVDLAWGISEYINAGYFDRVAEWCHELETMCYEEVATKEDEDNATNS